MTKVLDKQLSHILERMATYKKAGGKKSLRIKNIIFLSPFGELFSPSSLYVFFR